MERASLKYRLSEFAQEIVFGPKTEGVVVAIKRDSQNSTCWHTLVRTDQGKLKHFIEFDGIKILVGKNSLQLLNLDHEKNPRRGERYTIRTRGTGFTHMPWSKIDRDPFNLKRK